MSIGKVKSIESTTRRIIAKVVAGDYDHAQIEHMIQSLIKNRDNVIQRLKDKSRPRELALTEKSIAGALKDTINMHGDITPLRISSAAKRILGNCTRLVEESVDKSVYKRQANMVDGGTIAISDVFEAMNKATGKHMFIGEDKFNAKSARYLLFKQKGTTCVGCGLEATHFRKEKFPNDEGYHLNLYGMDHVGDEVLFTKDHIIPRARDGKNCLSNYQTMCNPCNQQKADKICT